jgi:ribosome maturation factor RimP
MADIAALTALIEPEAKAEGLALVRVKMTGGTSDPTLQVMAERPDTRQLSLEDCSRLSRRLSERLDALEAEGRDPIDHAYRLEVSSPGIDRPLTRLGDYDDWKGHEARVTLLEPLEGRKQYNGTLLGTESETVLVETKEGPIGLPFAAIRNAKLVLTDKLIQATAPLSADGADTIKVEGS